MDCKNCQNPACQEMGRDIERNTKYCEYEAKGPAPSAGKNEVRDDVNHPSHYTDGKIEVIDYIEDKHLPYHLGNVVKYISRAGKKDPVKTLEDLKKAQWYLNRYISKMEENNGNGNN